MYFLEGHFKCTGRIEFRLLPNQKYDHKAFSNAYWNKFIKNIKAHVDLITAYYVDDTDAHILLKLTNEYWVYIHIYGAYSGLSYWGADEITSYCNKDINYLINYGIAQKDYEKLGISVLKC